MQRKSESNKVGVSHLVHNYFVGDFCEDDSPMPFCLNRLFGTENKGGEDLPDWLMEQGNASEAQRRRQKIHEMSKRLDAARAGIKVR